MLEKEVSIKSEENSNIETTIEEKNAVAENIEQILEEEIEIEETEDLKSNSFTKEVLAGVVDQIVIMASSLVALLIFDLILKLFGYYVAEKEPMFLIIYIIINIIYAPICKKTKLKETIGRKVLLTK